MTGLLNITVMMSAWSLPASIGSLFLMSWRRITSGLLFHTPNIQKPQKGNKTDRKDAKWICDLYMCGMVKPSFIPPADIQ